MDYSIFFLFGFHIALLYIKIWALYKVFSMLIFIESPDTENYLLKFKKYELSITLFSILIVIMQAHFVLNFFNETDLFYYEYMAITDEIFFTFLTITYIKKEIKKNGKSKN